MELNKSNCNNKAELKCCNCKNKFSINDCFITRDKKIYCNSCANECEYDMFDITFEQIEKHISDDSFKLRKPHNTAKQKALVEEYKKLKKFCFDNEIVSNLDEFKNLLKSSSKKSKPYKKLKKCSDYENPIYMDYWKEVCRFIKKEDNENRRLLQRLFSAFYIDKIVHIENFLIKNEYNLNIREKEYFLQIYTEYHKEPRSILRKMLNKNTKLLKVDNKTEPEVKFGYYKQLYDEYFYFPDYENLKIIYKFLDEGTKFFINWYIRIIEKRCRNEEALAIEHLLFESCIYFATNYCYISEKNPEHMAELLIAEKEQNFEKNCKKFEIVDMINFGLKGSISQRRKNFTNSLNTYRKNNIEDFKNYYSKIWEEMEARIRMQFNVRYDSYEITECKNNNFINMLNFVKYSMVMDIVYLLSSKIKDIAIALKKLEIWDKNTALKNSSEFSEDTDIQKIACDILIKMIKNNRWLYEYLYEFFEKGDFRMLHAQTYSDKQYTAMIATEGEFMVFQEVNEPFYFYLLKRIESNSSSEENVIVDNKKSSANIKFDSENSPEIKDMIKYEAESEIKINSDSKIVSENEDGGDNIIIVETYKGNNYISHNKNDIYPNENEDIDNVLEITNNIAKLYHLFRI